MRSTDASGRGPCERRTLNGARIVGLPKGVLFDTLPASGMRCMEASRADRRQTDTGRARRRSQPRWTVLTLPFVHPRDNICDIRRSPRAAGFAKMTLATQRTTMRLALRAAAAGKLEPGWLFLASSEAPTLDAPCLLVVDTDEDHDIEDIAAELGFPEDGLDTATIEDTADCARRFSDPPTDELLLESFVYYWRFDAWLPSPGAPDPPPLDETKRMLDRAFFDELGEERRDVPCRSEGCARGAVPLSVFCRVHHFEMIKKRPCPFRD